ncbi:hypothetical protein JW905_04885 [bacterium]|nr:hypothetical protein [candidate division CSSED10-310 bacterium]
MRRIFLMAILIAATAPVAFGASFLFDATRAESAGDADWVIDAPVTRSGFSRPERYPEPDQCLIQTTTPESFWVGGYSAWGVELAQNGHHVETLPVGSQISFGECDNEQDLSHYDVYVIPEPQTRFFEDQKEAILNFVFNGGGLFIIANHCGSDRNNNGYDSAMVFNDLGAREEFAVHFEVDEGSGTGLCHFTNGGNNNFFDDPGDPILHGPFGDINPIGLHAATTMTISAQFNPSIKPLCWKNDEPQGTGMVTLATCTYGDGRVVLLVDSAPGDDGTGDPRDDLINGWEQNRRCFMNASHWLAQVPGMAQYTPCPNTTPTPTCPEGTFTPTPPATPTPTPEYQITADLNLNTLTFFGGDPFLLTISIINDGPALLVDQYIILEAYGHYFFHPSWSEIIDWTNRPLLTGTTGPDTILEFVWPFGAGPLSASFWAAITATDDVFTLYSVDKESFAAL